MSNVASRHLGSACRIYKNSAGKTIAIDEIALSIEKHQISFNKFHRHIDLISVKRTLLHLTVGGDRVVSLIQMIGDYDSIQEDSGNYLTAMWFAASPDENDLEVSFSEHVAQIGDTV